MAKAEYKRFPFTLGGSITLKCASCRHALKLEEDGTLFHVLNQCRNAGKRYEQPEIVLKEVQVG